MPMKSGDRYDKSEHGAVAARERCHREVQRRPDLPPRGRVTDTRHGLGSKQVMLLNIDYYSRSKRRGSPSTYYYDKLQGMR
jgi:hypothetical protein